MINHGKRIAHYGLALLCMGLLLGGCAHHGSLAAGNQYQDKGQYRAAYIEAKKVLQQNENNGQAWLLLGKASLHLGNPKDALSELQNARKHGVPASQWAVPLGQTLLVSGKLHDLLKALPANPSFQSTLAARVDVLRGDAYMGLKQSDKAHQAYQAALALDPKDPRALVGLANLARHANDPASASHYVQQALASAPHSPQAWMAKGDLAFDAGNFAGAGSDYEKVLGFKQADWLPQERFFTQARLAEAQTHQRQFDKALANIKQLEKMAPGQPYPHYLHAVVLYKQGHLGDAVSQLQQVLQASPDNTPAQFLMGAVNYAQGNYGQAQMYLSNVLGVDAKNVGARRLLALTYFREGRSDEAQATLKSTLPGNPSNAALRATLQKAVAMGAATPKALATASPTLPPVPNAPGVAGTAATPTGNGAFADARSALDRGDTAAAIKLLEAKPADGDAEDATRAQLLVVAYIRNKNPKQAAKVAADYATKHPKNSDAHVLYGTALVATGQRDKARSQYTEAQKLDPKNLAAVMNLGSLDAAEGHDTDAVARYKTVLKKTPNNSEAMLALGQLAERKGDNAEAIQRFQQAIAAQPKASAGYVALVMLYSHGGQFDEAAATAKKLADVQPDNPAALNALGAAELNADRHSAALEPLEKAVKLAPKDPLYRTNLARAQVLNKDIKAAKTNLAEVVKADPAQVQATTLLAFIKLHDHDLKGALALAKNLQQQPKARAAGFGLEGDLYAANKAFAKAAQAYQKGLKIHYDRALVLKTFVALDASGAKDPTAVLHKWLGKHADDDSARLLLAQYALDHAQTASAAEQYEKVLQRHPSNINALNNLAWIYTQQHNPKALELAKRAWKLAPASSGVQDTYGWALIVANQPKAALPILAKAAKAAPKSPAIQYHLAVAQARSGHKADALATLGSLQKSGTTFADKPAADKLYQALGAAGANGGGK